VPGDLDDLPRGVRCSRPPAIAAKPKSMPAYLKAIDGALPERLIEQLTDAKRRTQRAGAESSGEPERLAVSAGRPS